MTDYTLSGDAGSFGFTGYPTPARMFAGTGSFSLSGQVAELVRNITVTGTALRLKLTRLRLHEPIVTGDGKPQPQFQQWWQRQCESIEQAFDGLAEQVAAIQAAYDAAAQANAAASAANNAVTEVQELTETVQSTVTAIEDGTYNFDQITIGGQPFGNVGGNVGPLP